jgi:arylsulfatase A-like enzyme
MTIDSRVMAGFRFPRRADLAVAAFAITMITSGCAPDPQPAKSDKPLHYFLSDSGRHLSPGCSFFRFFARSEMYRLWDQALQPCTIGYGWSQPSAAGVLAFQKPATIEVFSDSDDYDLLIIEVRAYHRLSRDHDQRMRVFLNGRKISNQEISTDWATFAIRLPRRLLRRGSNSVSFGFSNYVHSPRNKSTRKKDHRRFAADLKVLALARSGDGRSIYRKRMEMLGRAADSAGSAPRVFDDASGSYRIGEPGTLVLPIEVSPTSTGLRMQFSARSDLDPIKTVVRSRIIDLDTGDAWMAKPPDWQQLENESGFTARVTVPIHRCADGLCAVVLRVRPEPEGATLKIAQPRQIIAGKDTQQVAGASADARHHPPGGRPDIVLITLDAARAGHFSAYGYHRTTTPNIDRLARDSLVFTNAFSLVPYTVDSVPTMITGRTFLDLDAIRPGKVLPSESVTLAERLRDAGYRTACFSANPYNSRARGTDQGYDEFFELWSEIQGRASSDPRFITERALELISEWDDSQPLHLQLHYMPPHAPYDPEPEFDIFSDPDYSGPCDGNHKTIRALDAGRRDPGNGCLDQVVAKYDGNLYAADHWIGRLLDALRARKRWENTVVLITGDHGEAALEHGRMGHNSTVFDEMLHVPFILRLPSTSTGRVFTSDRLVTLEDIVPTLLATVSLDPSPAVTGIDLSRTASQKELPRRHIITRTVHNVPTFALRTQRWKIILPASGHGLLFDLAADPGELTNLAFQRRPVYLALGQLLTAKMRNTVVADNLETTANLSNRDREMLEALGYVE